MPAPISFSPRMPSRLRRGAGRPERLAPICRTFTATSGRPASSTATGAGQSIGQFEAIGLEEGAKLVIGGPGWPDLLASLSGFDLQSTIASDRAARSAQAGEARSA